MKKILPLVTMLVGVCFVSQVKAQCKADFSFYSNGNGKFVFADSAGNRYTTETWTFGDGNSSNNNSGQVSHTYNRTGTYTVCRMVWDSIRSCRDTFCASVTYSASSCKALFSYSVSGDTVQFSDNSTNGVYLSWDFGDSKTSGATNPRHIYSKSGTYTVCLTIVDSLRTCSDKYCATVKIGSGCDASWTASTQNLYAGFRLNNFSTGKIAYKWTFGDGDSSTQSNPTHQYSKPGGYVVCLTLYDSTLKCSDTYCDSISVDTSNNTGCRAVFTAQVTRDTVVQLTNWSQGFTNFKWYFPNGGTSTNWHEAIAINKPGTYTICLFAEDSVSGCQDSVCKTVTIDSSSRVTCQASFRVAVDTSQKFKLFLINSSSNKASHSYSWSFGDGGTSTQRNPTHKYTSFGKYFVCLTISDSTLNCTSTFCDSLGLDSTGRLLKANGFDLEVIDDFVSVPEISDIDFKLYPNPVSSTFTIDIDNVKGRDANVKVFNLQGRLISQVGLNENGQTTVDLSQEVDGLYLVRIFDGERYGQTKIMKVNK